MRVAMMSTSNAALKSYLIFVTTATTGDGVLFQAGALFAERAQNFDLFWPILAFVLLFHEVFAGLKIDMGGIYARCATSLCLCEGTL